MLLPISAPWETKKKNKSKQNKTKHMWDTGFHNSNKFNSFSVVPKLNLKFVPYALEFTICRNNISAVELRISVILNVIYASRTSAFCFAKNNTTMALWCSVLDDGSLLIKKIRNFPGTDSG